jgi:predicted phosphodiesterase
MKLLVLSDLHVEFAPFEPDVEATEAADVVVLAGDIHKGAQGMAWAKKTFPNQKIIYVAGNHEFYGQHWDKLLDRLRAQARVHGIHFLENEAVTIEGIRFLGATLWTDFELFGSENRPRTMVTAKHGMNDFQSIQAEPFVNEGKRSGYKRLKLTPFHTLQRHQESLAWLKQELQNGVPGMPERTVVVSHHYPHPHSTHSRWMNDDISAIYGSNLPEDILLGANLWIHGHTHHSCDYKLENSTTSVRVVCNPRGYPVGWKKKDFENPNFNPGLLIEI